MLGAIFGLGRPRCARAAGPAVSRATSIDFWALGRYPDLFHEALLLV